jgi:hypothetical protein
MPRGRAYTVARTIRRIDALRERTMSLKRDSGTTLVLKDAFERDVLINALELLRHTVVVDNELKNSSSPKR